MEPVLLLCSIAGKKIEQQKIIQQLPEHRLKKIRLMKCEKDKLRCFYSWKLLEYGIQHYFGLNCADLQWNVDQHGKPYFQDAPQIQFNISHSGDWIGIALHQKPIGVDLQQIRPEKSRVAKRVMVPEEWNYYSFSGNPVDFFFTLWTLKESYCKYQGEGITLGLSRFMCYEDHGKIITDCTGCQFYSYADLPGYQVAVCCESTQKPSILVINLKNLERTKGNG